MSMFQATFDEAIWHIVMSIPRGQVMSYGEVAKAAGYPRHARMVSKAMSRSEQPLPWHRVVKANRHLAFPENSSLYNTQKQRLLEEGAAFLNGKVITDHVEEDLDALIWGPES